MGEVIDLPIRHRRRTSKYGAFVFIMTPWEAGSQKEVLESLQRVVDMRLGDFFPDGRFIVQVGDLKDVERDFAALQDEPQ